MSLLHPTLELTQEGLCRRCDEAQWHEGREHRCCDPAACACLTCHPAVTREAHAVFDALDALLGISVPKARREPRKHRVATPA